MLPLTFCCLFMLYGASAFISTKRTLCKVERKEPVGSLKFPIQRKTTLNGIPKLFRWLVDLYPVVQQSVGDGLSTSVDNFYLDMNGIIHTCTHSNNDKLIALNEKEMFQRIFAYTDRLYKLVRPKNLMFLAIDGVAPRAKMNQQRSRRFRSSKEREALLAEFVAKEGKLPDEESFDSNCITPGTEFMYRLGIAFRRWIAYKIESDVFWKNGAEIVFSGPDVPGEGEHKVMDMIRTIVKSEGSNYKRGSKRHCMYGLDADLIMLSLVTHEPFFILLREKMSRRKQNKDTMTFSQEDFEVLEISVLRKMLEQHFKVLERRMELKGVESEIPPISSILNSQVDKETNENESPPMKIFKFELERVIDDFVFMCFFVGNDFLPCLPHLDIADGSLNLMMNIYRDILPSLGGYLTDKADIHMPRVEAFLQEVSRREPLYFQQRAIDEKDPAYADTNYKEHYYSAKFGIDSSPEPKQFPSVPSEGSIEINPNVKLISKEYLQGLVWVLTYYHLGCASWTWYYPYLYAPLGSDLKNLPDIDIEFEKGAPFTPLLQLISVLPPQSGQLLPNPYRELMVASDSPLVEYYPADFEVDSNGKKNAWECIVRIPFINETTLLSTVSNVNHKSTLTEMERLRNLCGQEHRFKSPTISIAETARKTS